MNILIGTALIGGAAIWLFLWLPNAEWRAASVRAAGQTLSFTAPRVLVALLGAAFFAELLPDEDVQRLFGAEAGLGGLILAAALGPVTPGGAFVSFAVAAAALKAGAAPLMIVTYVTSWTLFSITRIIAYEVPLMGRRSTLRRIAIALPVPFCVAAIAALVL